MIPVPGPFAPSVTWHKAGTPTRSGDNNDVVGFTDTTVTTLAEYPGNSSENTAGADQVTADRVLLFSGSLGATALDEFTCSDGLRYAVNGQPAVYTNPQTGTTVTQVELRRVTG